MNEIKWERGISRDIFIDFYDYVVVAVINAVPAQRVRNETIRKVI